MSLTLLTTSRLTRLQDVLLSEINTYLVINKPVTKIFEVFTQSFFDLRDVSMNIKNRVDATVCNISLK